MEDPKHFSGPVMNAKVTIVRKRKDYRLDSFLNYMNITCIKIFRVYNDKIIPHFLDIIHILGD